MIQLGFVHLIFDLTLSLHGLTSHHGRLGHLELGSTLSDWTVFAASGVVLSGELSFYASMETGTAGA